ncbi:MAG: hypothetical protein IKL53_08750 [Lachnospiraceae bacterium]|nr:hypothetical protein [Lachnospiraceae bacterium]MBR3599954.1 hypothetical protein [Lachnospiraceae bacterium]
MSKVILCTTKEASHPFIFLNTKMEVNNYEELCFYIYNNTVLISKSSLSDKLFDWIRDEIGMPELAAKLTALSNKTLFAQDLLVEILNAGDYYEPEEIKTYVEAWQKYRKLSASQRKKLKADGYLGYRRYIKAASIYDDIIENRSELLDRNFMGNVYHNRAVAAANNLDVEDAKAYFLKAYELNNNDESLKGYLMVFASQNDSISIKQEMRKYDLGDDNFENLMLEIGDANDDVREMTIYSMLQRAIYNRMNKDMIDYDKRMDIILGQLKDEFREQAI